jgi:hypothetical protein
MRESRQSTQFGLQIENHQCASSQSCAIGETLDFVKVLRICSLVGGHELVQQGSAPGCLHKLEQLLQSVVSSHEFLNIIGERGSDLLAHLIMSTVHLKRLELSQTLASKHGECHCDQQQCACLHFVWNAAGDAQMY